MFETIDSVFLDTCQRKMAANQDPAHDWRHVKNVARAAYRIAHWNGIQLQPLLLAAISHDTYSGIDRVNHHLLSGAWVREVMPSTLHGRWTETVALCCEQHRASYKGEYTGIYQEAFAAADRGLLTLDSFDDVVRRSYQYSMGKVNNHEEAIQMVTAHMPEKFGINGYAKWPKLYRDTFSVELSNLQARADSVTEAQVRHILKEST